MQALKKYKNTARSLPDDLNWFRIAAPGIILCKDGSLLTGRYYRGKNLAYGEDSAWDNATDAANRALGKLDGGWALWIDAVRLPVSRFTDPARNHFPNAISEMIEAERQETLTRKGACLETEYALLLHYMPPLKYQNKIVELAYDDDTTEQPDTGAAALNGFRRAVDEFDEQLSAAVNVRPMQDRQWADVRGRPQLRSDLVNYLHFLISGELLDIPLPPEGCYLDSVIGEKEAIPGDMPRVGDMFVACVALSGYPFPENSYPGVLTALNYLPFPLRWSSRYIVLEQPEAEKQNKIIEQKWRYKARGWKGLLFSDIPPERDASEMADDASEMRKRTQSAQEGTGYYTVNIVLMDEDPDVLAENARVVRRTIRDAGYPTRLETVNTMDAWLGTLPGHCVPNVRRTLLHTTNFADLLPLSAPWQGESVNPCPMYPPESPPLIQAVTVGSTPIDVNIHVQDLPHYLIFGPSRTGKSTLQATIALQFLRYPNATVWAFDKGRSLLPTYRATGHFYDIGNDELSWCPLSILDTEADIVEAEEWIADCFHLQTGRAPLPHNTDAIHHAVQSIRNGTGRSISHFVRQVQDKEVREAMTFYTLNGPMGYMFDAESDGLAYSPVCGFEISELMGMGEKVLLPAFRYLSRRFIRALNGQPALLQISEAWTMFGHPVMRARISGWLKELRKLNTGVGLDTQSLSDANRSGILDILLESCPTRFYGANPAALIGTEEEPGPRQMYKKFNLTDASIEMIRQAVPKRHYLYQYDEDTALIDLRLGRKALKFVGAGSKKDLARINRLYRDHGDAWPQIWLNEEKH